MLAARAVGQDEGDPLAGLEVGDGPEAPAPAGWVTVTVRAAALNHHDLWSLRGVGLAAGLLPMVLGCDAAGVTDDGREVVVHAVVEGEDEGGGDWSILSERHPGTLAERVSVPARNLVDKPAELSFAEAACLPTAYLTAYRMLFVRGALVPGQRVLVQGAGGGVATAAIVLGAAAGLEVTATSRSAERLERAEALGARHVIASGARLRHRVDAVIETVGEATYGHSLRALRPGGRVIVAGATTGGDPPADLRRVFYRQLDILGSTMGTRDELSQLLRFLSVSGARPVVDSVRPLGDAAGAFARMEAGEEFGKLVVAP